METTVVRSSVIPFMLKASETILIETLALSDIFTVESKLKNEKLKVPVQKYRHFS